METSFFNHYGIIHYSFKLIFFILVSFRYKMIYTYADTRIDTRQHPSIYGK